jgi:hypothetical protein
MHSSSLRGCIAAETVRSSGNLEKSKLMLTSSYRGISISETIYMSLEMVLGVISSPHLLELAEVTLVHLEESC